MFGTFYTIKSQFIFQHLSDVETSRRIPSIIVSVNSSLPACDEIPRAPIIPISTIHLFKCVSPKLFSPDYGLFIDCVLRYIYYFTSQFNPKNPYWIFVETAYEDHLQRTGN
jgi:hypothetical protein